MTRETLFERTARQVRQNEPTQDALPSGVDVRLTPADLELVVLALGLLLVPAAATLQARLARLRP